MSEAEKRRLLWELEWKLARGEGTPEEQREWAKRLIELRGVK
jgi:hypothetical protein